MQQITNEDDGRDQELYILKLFVSGSSANSVRAISNLQSICETYLKGRYELEIIDIHQQPLLVTSEDVAAVPMLIKLSPLPKRRLIGNMSEKERVLDGLGLN